MTEGWTGGGTPDENDLTRRIEELANRAAEEMDAEDGGYAAPAAAAPASGGGVAAAEVASVRAEIGALRAELSSMGERVASAIAAQGTRLEETFAPLSERVGDLSLGDGGDSGALEARLASLEDTLSLVSERLESLTSDGANVTGERLGGLSRDLAALQSAVAAGQQELRGLVGSATGAGPTLDTAPLVDAQQRTAQAVISRVDESVGGLSSSVREAIDAFARSVERSLTALGGSVGAALAEARDAHHDHLDEVASSLDAPLQRMAVLYNDLVARVEAGAAGGGGAGREEMAAVVNGLQQIGGVQAQLARAVDELRQSGTTDLTGSIDALRQATAAEFGKLRAELVAVMSSGQERSIAAMEEADKLTGGRLVEIKRSLDKTTKGIETMTTAVEDSAAVLSRMDESWVDISRQTAEEVHAAASEELGSFREAATKELDSLRKSLRDTASGVLAARTEIDQGTRLLVAAGQSLLQYLAERDLVLEEERVRIFRDVLEEFGKGLNAKSRKHLTDRIDEALERHRDARDADRWRRKGSAEAKPAPVPLVVAPEQPPAGLQKDVAKAEAAGDLAPLTPVVAAPRVEPPAPVRAATATKSDKPAKAAKASKPAAPRPVAKKSATSAPAAKKAAAKPAKPAPTAARTAAAKAAKAALAKKSGGAAAKPAAKKAEPSKSAAKKGRATVDRLPPVSSPSAAIDAAAGPDVSLELGPTDVQAAIDAFTQAAGGAGRRPRS